MCSSARARADGSACSSRRRCRRPSGPIRALVQAVMAGGRGAIFKAREGVEDNYEEGARAVSRLRPTKKDVVVGVSASGMTQFVRGALTRARKAGREDPLRHVRPGDRAADVRRPDDRAGGRAGSHRRVHAAEGRHRDQDGAQHADDRRDDPDREDLRQPHGGRAHRVGEAEGPRPPHRQHHHRPRLRRGGQAAAQGAMERQGRRRHAEDRDCRIRRRLPAFAKPTISCAKRSAKTSRRGCGAARRSLPARRPRLDRRRPPAAASSSTSSTSPCS